MLHSLLTPTNRKIKINKQTNKKQVVKSSIADGRNSFLLWGCTHSELQSNLKSTIDNCYSDKSTIQPMICAIGNDIFDLKEYFVYFSNIFYKFENIVKSVDICFKLFQVLDLKYPCDSKLVWTLIQQYFYNIKLKSDEKSGSLSALLNDLNNLKS